MKHLAPLAAVVAILATTAAPALAQPYGQSGPVVITEYGFGPDFWRGAPESPHERLGWLDLRLQSGIRDGTITRSEHRRISRMLLDTRTVEARLMRRDHDQLTPRDSRYMQSRLDNMSTQIRWARTNGVDRPLQR